VQRASPQCSISLSLKSADSWRKTDTQTKQLLLLRQCLHGRGGQKEVGAMRASSIVGLLFAAVVLAAIPVSPQVTPRGVSLSVDKAQASRTGAPA
jgi:hypothetical protein